jgi:hypothetical protein
MEGDSLQYAAIERKLKKREICLPSDYAVATWKAINMSFPYRADYVTHDVLLNYNVALIQYNSLW